jgi:hypothetical protein
MSRHRLSKESLALSVLIVVLALASPAVSGEVPSHLATRDATVEYRIASDRPDTQASRTAARNAAQHLDFGAIPLGAPIASLPRGAAWQRGCHGEATSECSFDLNGVTYARHWDDNIVVMKTIEVNDVQPVWLPFGLQGDEKIDIALGHLEAQFKGVFEIATVAGERIVIAHSSNARLDYFEVSLHFRRNGRLSEVRASCCYN